MKDSLVWIFVGVIGLIAAYFILSYDSREITSEQINVEPQTNDTNAGMTEEPMEENVQANDPTDETSGLETQAEAGPHDEIIGMTRTEAEAYSLTNDVAFRVGAIDGEFLPVTMDFRPGRITAEIEGGVIVGYTVEAE